MQVLFAPIARLLSPRNRLWVFCNRQLDDALRMFEIQRLKRRAPHLSLIPPARLRLTGNATLRAYAYDIGFINAILSEYLTAQSPQVLDLGCGPGKGVCIAWQYLGDRGHYHGLDISRRFIDFDRSWYPAESCSFILADLYNAYYNPGGVAMSDYRVPLDDRSIDLVLALSLFTHLDRPDTEHYFREMSRLMKPGALALVTFLVIDGERGPGAAPIPEETLPGQPGWYNLSRNKTAEARMGVARPNLDALLGDDFSLVKLIKGHWRGLPAPYHQDIVLLRRK